MTTALNQFFPELESSRTCPWPRGASKTVLHVFSLSLGLGGQVLGIGYCKFWPRLQLWFFLIQRYIFGRNFNEDGISSFHRAARNADAV